MPRIYKIYDPDNADWPIKFRKTERDAGQCVKDVSDPDARPSIQVDLIDVKADLSNLLLALNGEHASIDAPVIKSWRGTKRGGLRDGSSAEEPNETTREAMRDARERATQQQDPNAFWDSLNASAKKK